MNPKGSDRVIIVDGEAPESSSDEGLKWNIKSSTLGYQVFIKFLLRAEIESFDIPVSPAREVSESIGSSQATNQSLGNEFSSAYHKKLCELFCRFIRMRLTHNSHTTDLKNEDLWNRLSGLLSKTIETSSKNLIATDQLLLKCQVSESGQIARPD